MDLKIHIERVPPNRWAVAFELRQVGIWKDPECSAARYLLDNNLAKPEDILQTNRGLAGSVGWFAKRRVTEDDSKGHTGTPRFVKWRPNPFETSGRISPDGDSEGPWTSPSPMTGKLRSA